MRRAWQWLGVVVLGACGAPAPVTKEQGAMELRRLLAPFVAGGEVTCGVLLVEMTGNFYGNVAQPALDPKVHSARKEKGDGYLETVWTNKLGDPRHGFTITIGDVDEFTDQGIVPGRRTTFRVANELRVRIFGDGHTLALDATASGQPVVLKGPDGRREVAEFRIRDGERQVR